MEKFFKSFRHFHLQLYILFHFHRDQFMVFARVEIENVLSNCRRPDFPIPIRQDIWIEIDGPSPETVQKQGRICAKTWYCAVDRARGRNIVIVFVVTSQPWRPVEFRRRGHPYLDSPNVAELFHVIIVRCMWWANYSHTPPNVYRTRETPSGT